MNRRGFFGWVAACLFGSRVVKAAPPPLRVSGLPGTQFWTKELMDDAMITGNLFTMTGHAFGANSAYQQTKPDVTADDAMRLVQESGTLDFWNEPGEDIYTLDDGEAV